ncbi:MAG TPA: amidohydrolase family protein [Gammaproteobacteria bacterium]
MKRIPVRRWPHAVAAVLSCFMLAACASAPAPAPDGSIAFVGRYFDGLDRVVDDGVVVVHGNRIHCAGSRSACAFDNAARVIHVKDGLIMPGLIDLHVHARAHYLPMFVPAGVTTIRDANNRLATIAQLQSLPGRPRIVFAGPMLDGPGSVIRRMSDTAGTPGEHPWGEIMPLIVETPAQARAAVAGLAERDVDVIKLYEQLPKAAFAAAVEAAHDRGIPVMADLGIAGTRGLTKAKVDAIEAARMGVDSIEHLSGFALAYQRLGGDPGDETLDPALVDKLVEQFAATRTAVVPTLTNTVHFSLSQPPDLSGIPLADTGEALMGGWWQQLFASVQTAARKKRHQVDLRFARALLPRLLARGVIIGAGTDTPAAPFTVPGAGVHQELAYLVDFGLSPMQALRAATGHAARILQRDDLGVIRAGARADIVVAAGDPTRNVTDTRRLQWVMVDGELHEAEALWQQLREPER